MADPPIQVTWDILRQALTENFVRLEDPDKVWHEIQGLKQQEAEPIDDYIKKFSLLWESLCQALQPQGAPPDMMKKDRFLAGLKENLRWRVELKKPRTYEDTLEVARNKEWKIKRLTQLGVSSLLGVPEIKQANFVQSRGEEEVHHTHVIPVLALVVPPIVTPIQDDGLRQDMRQVVDLMKNLSLNLLSNAGNHHGQGRQFNQTNNNGGHNNGGGKRWKNVPTCYNCGDARAWYKSDEEELQMADPPIQVTWDILRQVLTENFVRLEDPDKVWHEIQGLNQQEAEPIDDYIKKFSLLWGSLCHALQPQGAPPDMMKKDRFLAGLKENLHWRVELKKPRTYEDTLEVARNKEWKIKRLTQLGVSSLLGVPEMKQANFVQSRGQEEVHHTHVIPILAPVVPPIVTPIQDDGLRLCIRGDALLVVKQVLGVWKTKNSSLREICFKIKSLLKRFEAWSIRHIERAMNEEAHDAAQGMIGEIFVLKADRLLYCGREILAHEEEFLLPGVVSNDIEKPKKYGFLRRAYKYKLIGDVLYMLGADLVFEKWGIDAVGPLPITSRGKNYILTAVDYLSRWAEAKAVRQITAKDVAKFVYEEICCKFGVPLELLSDQGPGFGAELLDFLCEKMKITCKCTTSYYPQCNGVNERFNGKLVQILSKVTEHQGKNWDLEVPSALWAYRTAVKTDTGFTPFHLVYGKKALLPVEVEIPGIKMLEKVLGQSGDAFQQRLLHLWEG
ncbi:hypothetical protein L7F22_038140 [Adiantum nelumboides]|nr:hypothetical protein [Adiantum nelumboides]